jgi:hypothetical protein
MPLYQVKIVMKQYKIDEFVDSLGSLLSGYRVEKWFAKF